jgi:hypothetical protein
VPNEIPGLDIDAEIDEDDQGTSTKVVPKTAHELEDGDERILVPDADIISSHEPLERVGEIMSVQPRAVIVRGTSSSIIGNRALDAETLLVFEDRTVLGYVSFAILQFFIFNLTTFLNIRFMKHLGPHCNLSTL